MIILILIYHFFAKYIKFAQSFEYIAHHKRARKCLYYNIYSK